MNGEIHDYYTGTDGNWLVIEDLNPDGTKIVWDVNFQAFDCDEPEYVKTFETIGKARAYIKERIQARS